MTEHLHGKTALITGSTRRGIGVAAAIQLGLDGAEIILNYGTKSKDEDARARAEVLMKTLEAHQIRATVIAADIRIEADVEELFRQASEKFGGVDILVNNAGGAWIEQDFAAIDTRHWDQAIRSEIDGTFFCIRAALPFMRRKHWGRVINICLDEQTLALLVNAQYGHVLEKYPYDFALAKFAKREITHRLALAELKHGITINNILPGIIEEIDNNEVLRRLQGVVDSNTTFDPTDVARAIAFLCRDGAGGITRSDIRIPGNIYTRL